MIRFPLTLRSVGALLLVLVSSACAGDPPAEETRLLVFSKTVGFRHESIPAGIEAMRRLADENGYVVDATEDGSAFTDDNLARYQAVVFLNTSGNVLDPAQEEAFERFIRSGRSFVGVHAATDTEFDWPWYGRMVGGYFESHPNNPNVRPGVFRVRDGGHPSTEGLPERWERVDEFYNFRSMNPDVHVLVDIDESSYEGGTHGDDHPMTWYHDYDGGRVWYTAMGHTEESYSEPLFLQHLLGGIRYAVGE